MMLRRSFLIWSAVRIPSMPPTWTNAPEANFFAARLCRREQFRALGLKRLQGSPGWSGHQIVKLPAEYAVGVGKVQDDAHVVESRNRKQFGTFVPCTQQIT